MGVQHNVYVGPYLTITSRSKTVSLDLCQGHNAGEGEFCSECGRPKKRRIVEETTYDSAAWWENNEDRLVSVGDSEYGERVRRELVISNFTGKGGIHINEGSNEIREIPEGLGCTCPDWRFNGSIKPGYKCKHVQAHQAGLVKAVD